MALALEVSCQVATEPFYVAIITPVIHYCMGGLECTVEAECIDKSGKAIPGLYVAGEAAGGIHGNNRLGRQQPTGLRGLRSRGGQGGLQVHLRAR